MLATAAGTAAIIYVALHILLLLALAVRVSAHRRRAQVGLGEGSDPGLRGAIRGHGNAAENAAAIFAVLILYPLLAAPAWAVHLFGVATLLGRVLHAWGLSRSAGVTVGRGAGMAMTWAALLLGALGLLVLAFR